MNVAERRAWILVMVSAVAYGAYLLTVLGGTDGGSLTDVAYKKALLWTVGAAIAAGIALDIAAGVFLGHQADDQRDREINRFGEYIGSSVLVLGAVSALVLALIEAPYFWIANVIYLAFVLSALLSSTAKIFAYRQGFHPW